MEADKEHDKNKKLLFFKLQTSIYYIKKNHYKLDKLWRIKDNLRYTVIEICVQ